MAALLVKGEVTEKDLKIAQEEYGDYVKVVMDVETEALAIGGEWHAEGEKLLLQAGSRQNDLWGGGINLQTKRVDFNALINTRPDFNRSQEILDSHIRGKFEKVVREKFGI